MARKNLLQRAAEALVSVIADVAANPQQLKPGQLCALLNSTPLGPVIDDRRLREHRARGGSRVGDGKTVDLIRYAAWLWRETRDAPPAAGDQDASAGGRDRYAEKKERERARNAEASREGRDIGELPKVVDPARKKTATGDFRFFCETYLPQTFDLGWSDDHLRAIDRIEQAILRGGLFALAMPRGSGKTSLCEAAATWAILCGHRNFVALIGADKDSAVELLDSIKVELETNELLLEDFPEAVYPIHCLEGISNRAKGQTYRGERTAIGWVEKTLVMPTIPGSAAGGAIIRAAGLTGRIRGMKYKRRDGVPVRPDLVVIDDPQTDDSARSLPRCNTRKAIVSGAVLGLAGPGKKISGLMPCTIIRPGDMAHEVLDRDKHPEWQGEISKLVYQWPTDQKLWDEYARLRAECLKHGRDLGEVTEFYRANREAMDAGAVVAWPERKNEDELSAIQHAWNLRLEKKDAAFFAEYQNDPIEEDQAAADQITKADILAKTNGLARGEVPEEASHVLTFVDVSKYVLHWMTLAVGEGFGGAVIDYGGFPDQDRLYWTKGNLRQTLFDVYPGKGLEGVIYKALEDLTERLAGRAWPRDDGADLRIERALIDANYGETTNTVYLFVRNSKHGGILTPSHGKYVGASSTPFSEYKKKRGDRVGDNWRQPNTRGKRAVRHTVFDANWWKSFALARLATPMGERGCLSIFGYDARRGRRVAADHEMLADHLTAEVGVPVEGRGRVVREFKQSPGRDNDLLDCLVGCCVAASMSGISLMGDVTAKPKEKRQKTSLLELRNRKR